MSFLLDANDNLLAEVEGGEHKECLCIYAYDMCNNKLINFGRGKISNDKKYERAYNEARIGCYSHRCTYLVLATEINKNEFLLHSFYK